MHSDSYDSYLWIHINVVTTAVSSSKDSYMIEMVMNWPRSKGSVTVILASMFNILTKPTCIQYEKCHAYLDYSISCW